jgi:hypothetical protein
MSYTVVGNRKVYASIEDLPENQKITDGDRFLIQTSDGTALVDYANFKIDPAHTTFENTLTSLVDFTSTVQAFINEIDSSVETLSTEMSSTKNKITEFDEKIAALSYIMKLIMGKCHNKEADFVTNLTNSTLSGSGLTLFNEILNEAREGYSDFDFGYNSLARV